MVRDRNYVLTSHGDSFVAEIASVIAVVVALGALFLASQAYKQVGGSFDDFTKKMAKHVSAAQNEFAQQTQKIEKKMVSVERDMKVIDKTAQDQSEKLNTLLQRVNVLEHELQSLIDSIPKQYRRQAVTRDDNKTARNA